MAWNDYEDLIERLNESVAGNRLIAADDFAAIEVMLQDEDVRKQLGYDHYCAVRDNGDFSHFETLHPILRNYAASRYMQELPDAVKDAMQGRQEDGVEAMQASFETDPVFAPVQTFLQQNAMNPLLRLGCSLASREDWHYAFYDDKMTEHLMCETLRPMNRDQIDRVRRVAGDAEKGDEQVLQNIEKQVQMARTLLMAHIGNAYVYRSAAVNEHPMNRFEEGYNELTSRSVASMVSHCSRTAFVLPASENPSRLMESAVGGDKGKASGVYKRISATHSSSNGASFRDYKEGKGANIYRHYGMDVAIGGLGNPGIQGAPGQAESDRMLKNDGSCGHMYMRLDESGPGKTGSLLIGFESDSPSASHNQQGHKHTITAKGEHMSSFLGQRNDEFGDKYGGRKVDCTGFDADQLADILDTFSNHYRSMLVAGINFSAEAHRVQEVNSMLAGNPIGNDYEKLAVLFNLAGIEAGMAADMANTCAAAKVRAAEMMKDTPDLSAQPQYVVGALQNPQPEIAPMQELKKPNLWTRFKARLGVEAAKAEVSAYANYCNALNPPAAAVPAEPADTVQAQQRTVRGNEPQRQHERVVERESVGLDALRGREEATVSYERVSGQRAPERQMGGRDNH